MKETAQIKLLNETGFAKTVIMPGDPIRAKMIAETFLENAVLVNNVRVAQGYTGYYKGKKISVMASGMGMPSMGIYSYELFNFFDVENIIRVGTAGGLTEDAKLKDVVVGLGANTDSNYANQFCVNGTVAPVCSYELLLCAVKAAEKLNIKLKVGNFYSTDVFYNFDKTANEKWAALGSVAVEMESASLYLNALKCKKRALAICTISDLPLVDGCPGCTVEERENTFTDMIKIALEIAAEIQ
ncbi:MAG: purine-nucleoside phosphorylase [Clostridia bacterium]|nr:purine-nucleoside phosphorylase [Clostridia bacterium]